MLGFLQGFAWGLGLSCLPWFMIGLFRPDWALPHQEPRRSQLFVRYLLLLPFISFASWITSLWGGWWIPSLSGWLTGIATIPLGINIERWLRRRYHAYRAQREALTAQHTQQARALQRENGLLELDPERPPADADTRILAMIDAKRRLLAAQRPDLALQADRLYTRYMHLQNALRSKFDPRELTFDRANSLITQVSNHMLETLGSMGALAESLAAIDATYVHRQLDVPEHMLPGEKRQALHERLQLIDDTNQRLQALVARNETVLTTLDDAAVALAGIETSRRHGTVSTAEQALDDLRRFADQAERYNRAS